MIEVFGDTFFFLALNNPSDLAHDQALAEHADKTRILVTTAWVLTEVGDALADPGNREQFCELLDLLESDLTSIVLPVSQELFEQGVSLYRRRPDKAWALTDCISFVVMADRGITDALTGDRHFEQAGFRALLR